MIKAFFFISKKVNEFKLNLNSLYDFYLPVVGKTATNLYVLLANMVENSVKNNNLTFNSDYLAKQLNVNEVQLIEAKNKLEAIGLLSTYISTNSNKDQVFIFVLKSALNYEEFTSNPKYKQLLINQIGSNNYQYLEYKNESETDLNEAIEVTTNFDSVFNTESVKNLRMIDFEQLYNAISKTTSLPLVLSDEAKNLISDIYSKYQVSLHDIEMIIYDSIYDLNGVNNVSINLLIENFNKFINKSSFTTSLVEINRNFAIFSGLLNKDEEDKILVDYKMCNAELYLASIFKRPLEKLEKNAIGMLKDKYHLTDELINVLVDFSLNKTNGKINKKYLAKTANTINGLGLTNAKQVVNHFKKAIIENNPSINNIEEEDKYFSKGF